MNKNMSNEKGKLYLVATPIGNLGDITYRAIDTLKSVDYIVAEDTRQSMKLLKHFEISKKCISYHKYNENERSGQLIKDMLLGQNIGLITDAGTPGISDPGEVLVKACIENGIDVVPIPGAVALVNALICSGIDTSSFVFEGFLPGNTKQRRTKLTDISKESRTIIIYEAPHKLLNTLDDLKQYLGNRNICLCRELTKIYEEFKRLTIDEAISYYKEHEPKGEFVVVIEGYIKEEKMYTDKEIISLVDSLIKQGINSKEAMKEVGKEVNRTKSDIYRIMMGEK